MGLASCMNVSEGFPSFVHNYSDYDSNYYNNCNFNEDQIDVESIFLDPSMYDFNLDYSYIKKPVSVCEEDDDIITTQTLKRQNCNYVGNSVVSPEVKKGRLSAQSEAARKRRRKISEKTKELGKFVPGGKRMNTAEMLDAAFKYVKYMEAQIQVLKFMPLIQVEEEEVGIEEMKVVSSSRMQEKLYMENKCLVPWNIVFCLNI